MIDLPQPLVEASFRANLYPDDWCSIGKYEPPVTVLDDDPFTFGIVIASNDPFTDVRHPPQEDE